MLRMVSCGVLLCALGACAGSDADGDGFEAGQDCDDASAAVHPGAMERCNSVDDNCNGQVDDDPVDGASWIGDADGDGWGMLTRACTMPAGTVVVAREGDCDDAHATAFPGSTATEVPKDGIDTDCDGQDLCTDLNCDGRPDVVVPSHHDGDYMITQPARLLSGTGGWKLETTPVTMSGTLGSAVFDLNADGYQDIVHASFHDGTTVNTPSFVYWGPDHDGARRDALPTHGAHWVCMGDLDGNGWTDLVFANNSDGATNAVDSYVYWNRGGAFSAADRLALPTNGATHCAVDDLDADGHPEIVFSNYASGVYTLMSFIYWGSEGGSFSTARRTELPTVGAYSSTIADVDGDGTKDVVFWSHYSGTSHLTDHNYIYWNRGGFSAMDRTALPSMGGFRGAVVDLDKDGHNDVIAAGYNNGPWTAMSTTYIYWGNAANLYSVANRTSLSLKGVLDTIVDDLNADGHLDVLLTSHHDGDSYAPSAVFWGTAGGTYNDTNRTELPGYHVTYGGGVADFNHDGFKDVFLPGFHNNITGADMMPWTNQAFSRIYWGSATGLKATFFDQWPTRGAWSAVIVGN